MTKNVGVVEAKHLELAQTPVLFTKRDLEELLLDMLTGVHAAETLEGSVEFVLSGDPKKPFSVIARYRVKNYIAPNSEGIIYVGSPRS